MTIQEARQLAQKILAGRAIDEAEPHWYTQLGEFFLKRVEEGRDDSGGSFSREFLLGAYIIDLLEGER